VKEKRSVECSSLRRLLPPPAFLAGPQRLAGVISLDDRGKIDHEVPAKKRLFMQNFEASLAVPSKGIELALLCK